MNLKIGFMLIGYYTLLSLFFILGSGFLFNNAIASDHYTSNININPMHGNITANEQPRPWTLLTGGGLSLGRFFALILFGIGLPSTVPFWFALCFAAWQTMISILSLMFIINSFWSGG